MNKIKIKQIRSGIGHPARQKKTLVALGLNKINRVAEHKVNPQIMGMVNRVKHLIEVEEL